MAAISTNNAFLNNAGGLLNAHNSYSSSSAYGYSLSDAIANSYSRVYGSQASAQDILRAQEANILNDAYLQAQMQYNSAEAAKQREWQEYMSSTAYQRAIADLKAAGLNPILAGFNGGASTPSGGYGASGLQTATKAQTFADSESSSNSQSKSKSENWESSSSSTETQLKELLAGLGSVIATAATAFGNAVSGEKVFNFDFNGEKWNTNANDTSPSGDMKTRNQHHIPNYSRPQHSKNTNSSHNSLIK